MEEIIRRYNGYSWDGNTFVCNPYSIISLLYHQEFKNFWFETGTPTFLMKKFKETNKSIHASINKMVKESVFNKYDIENINTTALLFQTGYLTIKKYDRAARKYLLEFPNEEVREAFLDFAVEQYAHSSPDEMEHIVDTLLEALKYNAMDQFFTALQALFSSITARQLDKVKEYEGFYHSIIYIVLKMMGIRLACEVQSHFGSTDAVIWTEQYIYILEFKMGKAQAAVEQIKQKNITFPILLTSGRRSWLGLVLIRRNEIWLITLLKP